MQDKIILCLYIISKTYVKRQTKTFFPFALFYIVFFDFCLSFFSTLHKIEILHCVQNDIMSKMQGCGVDFLVSRAFLIASQTLPSPFATTLGEHIIAEPNVTIVLCSKFSRAPYCKRNVTVVFCSKVWRAKPSQTLLYHSFCKSKHLVFELIVHFAEKQQQFFFFFR